MPNNTNDINKFKSNDQSERRETKKCKQLCPAVIRIKEKGTVAMNSALLMWLLIEYKPGERWTAEFRWELMKEDKIAFIYNRSHNN